MRLTRKIAIALTVCCTTSVSCSTNGVRASDSIYYSSKARTYYERFMPDPERNGAVWWEGGNIRSWRNTKQQKDALFDEITGAPLRDCSDTKYRCVYGAYRVFAVPRGGLTLQSIYRAGGAMFRVEKCLRGGEARCQVALISSDCQQLLAPDRCTEAHSGAGGGNERGRVGYFVFKEGVGVTAYGSVAEPATTPEAQMAAAHELLLRGTKGLLADGALMPTR